MNDYNLNVNMAFRVSEQQKTILKSIVDEHDTSISLLIRALCRLVAENKITITKEMLEAEKFEVAAHHVNKKPLQSPGRPRKKNLVA